MAKSDIRKYTRKDTAEARQFAHTLLREIHKQVQLSDKKIKYNHRRVGSAATNTSVGDARGIFDLDYQFVLSDKCDTSESTRLRNIFSQATKDALKFLKHDGVTTVQDSTSVITVLKFTDGDKKVISFNVDFAMVGYDIGIGYEKRSSIIRRNAQGTSQHEYTWNLLATNHTEVFKAFKELSTQDRSEVCDEVVKRKIKCKQDNDDKPAFSHFVDILYERYAK
jgi:hypothetical protein